MNLGNHTTDSLKATPTGIFTSNGGARGTRVVGWHHPHAVGGIAAAPVDQRTFCCHSPPPPTCPHRAFAVTNCARSASCTAMYCGSHTPLERHAMASASQGARDPASAPAPNPSLNRGVHTSTSDRAHCSPATTAGPAQWGTARRVQAPPPPRQIGRAFLIIE